MEHRNSKVEGLHEEFHAMLEHLIEETNLKEHEIYTIYYLEVFLRNDDLRKDLEKEPIVLSKFMAAVYPLTLRWSYVAGIGAPRGKILHSDSLFQIEEKLSDVHTWCNYFLFSSELPEPKKRIRDGILFCMMNFPDEPYRIGIINPNKEVGKQVTMEEYCSGIPNSNQGTFRKFYSPESIRKVTTEELLNFTRDRLKERIPEYEAVSNRIYKTFHPIITESRQLVQQELLGALEKFLKGGKLSPYG